MPWTTFKYASEKKFSLLWQLDFVLFRSMISVDLNNRIEWKVKENGLSERTEGNKTDKVSAGRKLETNRLNEHQPKNEILFNFSI